MAIFRKYEFDSYEHYRTLYEEASTTNFDGLFVELGNLRSDKYSVDVLWNYAVNTDWKQYEIWDIVENGSHTFLGTNFNPDEQNTLNYKTNTLKNI
jgi:hypothetical protein